MSYPLLMGRMHKLLYSRGTIIATKPKTFIATVDTIRNRLHTTFSLSSRDKFTQKSNRLNHLSVCKSYHYTFHYTYHFCSPLETQCRSLFTPEQLQMFPISLCHVIDNEKQHTARYILTTKAHDELPIFTTVRTVSILVWAYREIFLW